MNRNKTYFYSFFFFQVGSALDDSSLLNRGSPVVSSKSEKTKSLSSTPVLWIETIVLSGKFSRSFESKYIYAASAAKTNRLMTNSKKKRITRNLMIRRGRNLCVTFCSVPMTMNFQNEVHQE